MITITLNEEQAALITYALMSVEAPWNDTNPLIMMIANEFSHEEALKKAVKAPKPAKGTQTAPKQEGAPYGLRKDGKPRGRPGRPKKVQ